MQNQGRDVWAWAACGLCIASGWVAAESPVFRSYHIGNSLTWDSRPDFQEALAIAAGIATEVGFHINCGRSLPYIQANPDQSCVVPPPSGLYAEALPSRRWDAVTLQLHMTFPKPTLGEDLAALRFFVELAQENPENASTQFFLYTGWPGRDHFVEWWDEPGEFDLETETAISRAYYDAAFATYADEFGESLRLIPVGEVLYHLKERIENGQVPDVFNFRSQLYRDAVHMTRDYGRHVAAVTAFSVLHRIDPRSLLDPEIRNHPANPTPWYLRTDTLEATYQTIWEVISADPRTGMVRPCPFDLTGPSLDGVPDGQVNVSDLNYFLALWLDNDPAADLTGPALDGMPDGVVTVSDLNFYIAGWMDEQGACP